MLIRSADAIASSVSSGQLNENFIMPSVFDQGIVQKVAAAVKKGD
jgi:malic enzyme